MSLTTDTVVFVDGARSGDGTFSLGGLDSLKSRTTSDMRSVRD